MPIKKKCVRCGKCCYYIFEGKLKKCKYLMISHGSKVYTDFTSSQDLPGFESVHGSYHVPEPSMPAAARLKTFCKIYSRRINHIIDKGIICTSIEKAGGCKNEANPGKYPTEDKSPSQVC